MANENFRRQKNPLTVAWIPLTDTISHHTNLC